MLKSSQLLRISGNLLLVFYIANLHSSILVAVLREGEGVGVKWLVDL